MQPRASAQGTSAAGPPLAWELDWIDAPPCGQYPCSVASHTTERLPGRTGVHLAGAALPSQAKALAGEILELALKLLGETEAGARKVRLLGITVSNFSEPPGRLGKPSQLLLPLF